MLDKIRRPGRSYKEGKFKKIFSYIVFGLICIVFLFIAPMGVNLTGQGVVGQVGDVFIKQRELRNLEESLRNRYKRQLEQANEEMTLRIQKKIRSQALQNLVQFYITLVSIQKEGLFLTDEELVSAIKNISLFQEKGRFLHSRYIQFLKNQKLNKARFDAQIRKEELVNNWKKAFIQAIGTNQLEEEKKQGRYQYKVSFRYAELQAEEVEEEKLEPFVKSKNKKEIEKSLKKAQIKWEKTGVFSLFFPLGVSIARNETVMKAIINHVPSTGLVPQFIRDNNIIYVVDILSFTEGKINPEEKKIMSVLRSQNFDKLNRLFNSWLSFQREHIKFKNELLINLKDLYFQYCL